LTFQVTRDDGRSGRFASVQVLIQYSNVQYYSIGLIIVTMSYLLLVHIETKLIATTNAITQALTHIVQMYFWHVTGAFTLSSTLHHYFYNCLRLHRELPYREKDRTSLTLRLVLDE
jgi:hypothetical protein